MAWAFGTWNANGVDNNTGIVKVNALGILSISSATVGTFGYSVPSGYTLDFLVQPTAASADGRVRIEVSGSNIVISAASSNDYSVGTYPKFATQRILVYVR